ncbi:Cofilin [Drechslerella dactyloides]|uniref:Cofilin n=1 Tax=Drechslerella dactyloides TaxID=74499 RepID=A0AAD6J0R4_DREDA|nr:Cofilin [Drechslerella dactyloides]
MTSSHPPSDIPKPAGCTDEAVKATPPSGEAATVACDLKPLPIEKTVVPNFHLQASSNIYGDAARPRQVLSDPARFRPSLDWTIWGWQSASIRSIRIQAATPHDQTKSRWTVREYICIVSGLCLIWQVTSSARTDSLVLAILCGLGLFQLSLIYAYLFFWLFTAAPGDTPAPAYRVLVYLVGFLPQRVADFAVHAIDLGAAGLTAPGPLWLGQILEGLVEGEPDDKVPDAAAKVLVPGECATSNLRLAPLLYPSAVGHPPAKDENGVSGVAVSAECISKFDELKLGKKLKYIIYKLNDKQTEIVVEQDSSEEDAPDSSEAQYENFVTKLPETDCRWAIYDFGFQMGGEGMRNKICFISWAPDDARVKAKMIYASSKDALRRSLNGVAIEIQGSDFSEVSYETVLEKCLKGR